MMARNTFSLAKSSIYPALKPKFQIAGYPYVLDIGQLTVVLANNSSGVLFIVMRNYNEI